MLPAPRGVDWECNQIIDQAAHAVLRAMHAVLDRTGGDIWRSAWAAVLLVRDGDMVVDDASLAEFVARAADVDALIRRVNDTWPEPALRRLFHTIPRWDQKHYGFANPRRQWLLWEHSRIVIPRVEARGLERVIDLPIVWSRNTSR